MTIAETDEFLAHFGVKGMKWGVRKAGEPPISDANKELRKAALKNYRKQSGPIFDARFDRQFGDSSKISYKDLSTKKYSVAAGKEFHRLSMVKDETSRSMTYVSTNKADQQRYQVALSKGAGLGALSVAPKQYKITYDKAYKSMTKLTSPSEKERVDAFIELIDSDIPVGSRGRTVKGATLLRRAGYGGRIAQRDKIRYGEQYYRTFASNQYMKQPLNTAYFNSIRAKGYNALVDDNDRNIVADDPLMLLNPSGTVKLTSVRRISNDELTSSIANFTPPKALRK